TDDGLIWVATDGMTLYTNNNDSNRGKVLCTNVPGTTYNDQQTGLGDVPLIGGADFKHKSCSDKWPAYLAHATPQPAGGFWIVDRREGGRLVAFQGTLL